MEGRGGVRREEEEREGWRMREERRREKGVSEKRRGRVPGEWAKKKEWKGERRSEREGREA